MVPKKPEGAARDEAILVRVTPKTLKAAEDFAKRREWSLSHLGDIALREYLETRGASEK